MRYLPLFILLLLACESTPEVPPSETPSFCDCRELHYDHIYNVYHQGDPKQPFTGLCKDFYRGGFLKKTCDIKDGKYHGFCKFYYQDGTLKSSKAYEIGLMTGDQKFYDESGTLIYHAVFKRNKLIEQVFPLKDSLN